MTPAIENRNEAKQETPALSPLQQRPTRADTTGAGGSASISANDFLTLLVTEMKNQDPTANTDPNEYINQLVNVNSLQQLISINEKLSGVSASPGSRVQLPSSDATQPATSAEAGSTTHSIPTFTAVPRPGTFVEGNLGVPHPSASANRVAQALSGGSIVP